MPEWSCFNVIESGKVIYLHDEATLLADGIRLRYGNVWGEIRYRIISKSELRLDYSVEGLHEAARAVVNLPLWMASSDREGGFSIGERAYRFRSLEHLSTKLLLKKKAVLQWRGCEITLSADAALLYPVDGYTPYHKESSEDAEHRRQSVIQVSLHSHAAKFRIVLRTP